MPENLTDKGWVTIRVPVPPELDRIGVTEDLQRFFDAMIYKLRRNAHKGRWPELPLEQAVSALLGEVVELETSVGIGSTSEIWMEAADVANQALIVASIALAAKARKNKPTEGGQAAVNRAWSSRGEFKESDGVVRRDAARFKKKSDGAPGF